MKKAGADRGREGRREGGRGYLFLSFSASPTTKTHVLSTSSDLWKAGAERRRLRACSSPLEKIMPESPHTDNILGEEGEEEGGRQGGREGGRKG